MTPSLVARRCHALLLVVVMTFAALAPSLARAIGTDPGAGLRRVEACTSQGLRSFLVAPDGSVVDEAPADPAAAFEHCQFCSLGGAGAPPPATVLWPVEQAGRDETPASFNSAPRRALAWAPACARAPPHSV